MKQRLFLLVVLMTCVAAMGFAQDIRNSNNSLIARISSDGEVRNSNNSLIGYARGVPMRYAALYFFFNLF